jgi:hypothetical protein
MYISQVRIRRNHVYYAYFIIEKKKEEKDDK